MKRTLSTAAVLLALVTTLSAAHAGLPSPFDIKRSVDRQIARDLRNLDLVPSRLLPEHRAALRPYFAGNQYDRRQHRYTSIYRFPVRDGGRIVYRPYAYTDDGVLIGISFGLPALAVQILVPAIPSRGVVYVYDDRPVYYRDRYRYDRGPGWHRGRGHDRDDDRCDHDRDRDDD
ncbi:MAG: hypothetical protein U0V87_04055 [Acidobacteriota bacterium]